MENLKDVKSIINNPMNNDSTPNDQSDDPEHCICTECDHEEELGLEDDCCSSKKCSKCGAEMMDSVFNKMDEKEAVSENNIINWSDKMKKILESKLITPVKTTKKKICNECKTIISENYYSEETGCPKCGETVTSLTESLSKIIESDRRFICPNCNTSTKYTKINESECPICSSIMTVFGIPEIKKQPSGLPIED